MKNEIRLELGLTGPGQTTAMESARKKRR